MYLEDVTCDFAGEAIHLSPTEIGTAVVNMGLTQTQPHIEVATPEFQNLGAPLQTCANSVFV